MAFPPPARGRLGASRLPGLAFDAAREPRGRGGAIGRLPWLAELCFEPGGRPCSSGRADPLRGASRSGRANHQEGAGETPQNRRGGRGARVRPGRGDQSGFRVRRRPGVPGRFRGRADPGPIGVEGWPVGPGGQPKPTGAVPRGLRPRSARAQRFTLTVPWIADSFSGTSLRAGPGRVVGPETHRARTRRRSCPGSRHHIVPTIENSLEKTHDADVGC